MIDSIIAMTLQEFSTWIRVTVGSDIEIRESDYNRYKSFMREARSIGGEKANRYLNIMENLFSGMKIENDFFFGNIYISNRNVFTNAFNELRRL